MKSVGVSGLSVFWGFVPIALISFMACNCNNNDARKIQEDLTAILNLQASRAGAAEQLKEQNNPGHHANNFTYLTSKGIRQKMYSVNARFTMLFFYNPECEACKEYKAMLSGSKTISDHIKAGTLKVLAMYIDEDLSVWRRHLPEMPKAWIQGRDENEYLYKNNVYDLHAIPTIYLLDKEKKVILKDVLSITVIENKLK